MKSAVYTGAVALALAGVLSACAPPAPPRPADTGNMAYPAPLPQGNVGTTAVGMQQRDTGNMAYPAPLPQGNLSTTTVGGGRRPADTGNMSYPAPLPQGNVATTPVR